MIRGRTSSILVLAIGLIFAAIVPAAAIGDGSAGTLHINQDLATKPWQRADCPSGTPGASPICYTITGSSVVPGLGETTEGYSYIIEDSTANSTPAQLGATITAPEGTFSLSATDPTACGCGDSTLAYTITGGTGAYAGASGSGTISFVTLHPNVYWSGTLNAPDSTFDTSPPVIDAKSKTVRAPKHAERVRVKYTVTAEDAGSGTVPVTCKPRSGSRFKIGRTTVRCSAIDAVGNTATAHFRITVKRR